MNWAECLNPEEAGCPEKLDMLRRFLRLPPPPPKLNLRKNMTLAVLQVERVQGLCLL